MTARWQALWLAGSTGLSPGFCDARQVNSQLLCAVAGGHFRAGAEVQGGEIAPLFDEHAAQ
ncbi:hypothetical protein A6723_005990 [Pseudomonas sp. AU11447]|nr:hypothetical protein A6723_005990 [Pseudomonas sp. AU11447]